MDSALSTKAFGADVSRENPRGDLSNVIRFAVALGGFWVILVWNLAGYWSTIPQYSFGWLVPLLTIVLLAARWKDRPIETTPGSPKLAWAIIAVSAVAVLPTWVLEQPNSDWRLVSWALAIETCALTCGLVYCAAGGKVLRHFLAPLLFFLTAVPWPFNIEWLVIQGLTRFVVAVAIDCLNVIGIGALQHGNLIEVSGGMLDVTEACSGIRSLQSSFMVALFLGEFYRLSAARRAGLVMLAVFVAVTCNITRASFLAYLASQHGMESSAHWHDSAGLSILTICFICVWIAAVAFSRKETVPATGKRRISRRPISWPLAGSLGLWFVITLGATEAWYRHHEEQPALTWTFRWPRELPGFQEQPISSLAVDLLQFDSGAAAQWPAADGTLRAAFFLKWNPGESRARIPSRSHRPEVCLSASGYSLRKDLGVVHLAEKGIDIPFEHYLFEKDGDPVNVFFCVWQDHPPAETAEVERYWSRFGGLLFALHGQRRISQQMLEFAMFGPFPPDEALSRFKTEVSGLIGR